VKVGDLVRLRQKRNRAGPTGIIVKTLLFYPGVRAKHLVLVGDSCYKLCASDLEVIGESR